MQIWRCGLRHLDPELVFRIQRERVLEQGAAASAQREPLDAPALRDIRAHSKRFGVRRRLAIADGDARYRTGSGDVPIQQRRRNLQNARNVVEAVARVIRRQERRHIDIDGQNVAYRALILGSVQTMEGFCPSGIRLHGREPVDLALQP